jgi:hypothetical protein
MSGITPSSALYTTLAAVRSLTGMMMVLTPSVTKHSLSHRLGHVRQRLAPASLTSPSSTTDEWLAIELVELMADRTNQPAPTRPVAMLRFTRAYAAPDRLPE